MHCISNQNCRPSDIEPRRNILPRWVRTSLRASNALQYDSKCPRSVRLTFAEISFQFGEIDMTKQPKKPLDHLSPLDFLRMDIMNASLAVEHDLTSENDTDCAVKGTNVLLAVPDKHGNPSRITFDPDVPNHSNVSEFFDFKSITMKPLGPAPFLTLAEVHAWRIRNGTALKVYSAYVGWGQKGFVNPIVGEFPKLWSGWGEDVNVVEVLAYTQERKPWQLCIGRLEFELHEK